MGQVKTRARRATYIGNRRLFVGDAVVVGPEPGEVRIDVAYTGICGTDLHILHGAMDQRVTLPAVIGHEMSGRVADIGAGVTGWAVGDPVTVMPLDWCADCPACHRGFTHICQQLNFMGIDSAGSLQSSWTVPARHLVRLPPDLALPVAALVEPTAVAVHDIRRGGVEAGEKVLVVGGGPVGLLIALAARAVGAQVLVLELDEHRRGIAQSIGIDVLDPPDNPVLAVQEWTDGVGADIAFEVSGSAGGVTTSVQALAVRGRLVMVGIHSVPREVDLFRVFWRELTVIGARVYERGDFDAAVQLLSTGRIPADALISRIVPLDDAAEALAVLERGEAMKILVDCQAV
jgi:(R,R)-butanediol dehydrogenase/meso-butanediol dehydrogenase/diacetyl reductase